MSTLQQVNLIDMEHKGQNLPFSFINVLMITGIVLVFFMLLQVWGGYQTSKTRNQIIVLEAQQAKVLKQLETLRQSSAQNTKGDLEQRITRTRAELDRRRQVLQIMKSRDMVNEDGFAAHLTGLSAQYQDGLSLDHFSLWRGGAFVELSGWTYRPESAPAYVQRLQGENCFSNSQFGNLTIERAQDKRSDALRFRFSESKRGGQ